jgi:hypothetical protein
MDGNLKHFPWRRCAGVSINDSWLLYVSMPRNRSPSRKKKTANAPRRQPPQPTECRLERSGAVRGTSSDLQGFFTTFAWRGEMPWLL